MKNSTDDIRSLWINLFIKNNYLFLPSSPLIPKNDPSLLWINSGVAALKSYFSNPILAPSNNLVNCQPVIRTNDIDRIDANSYHQTLFEMLGCFSIGGNFKKEVIPLIWSFFTDQSNLFIKPEKLFITVLDDDDETYKIWLKQDGIIPQHILKAPKSTNFWDMGDGPCGPNTEIYYKFSKLSKDEIIKLEDLESKDFIEIINVVFSEFYRHNDKYDSLPTKCVDVGAGLERIALVLQNSNTTFNIDIWKNSVEFLESCFKNNGIDQERWRLYVIVDHLRTAIFSISDGALSGHKKHGYILKKLLKKSCLFAYIVGIEIKNLIIACEKIIESNSFFYPNLSFKREEVVGYIKIKLEEFIIGFKKSSIDIKTYLEKFSEKEISAEQVFLWYDTKGIPLEIINLSLFQEGRFFDQGKFNDLLKEQKIRSSETRAKTSVFSLNDDLQE